MSQTLFGLMSNPPSSSPNAGTVPDHGVFRALISVTHPVSVPSIFVKASLFRFRFALATKAAAPSVTGTNQGVAQVDAFPLLIYLIVIPVVKTTRLVLADSHRDLRLNDLLSLPLAPPGSSGGHSYPQGQDSQQQQPGPRTPEHLETVRGETPSPGGKLPPSLVPFAACGKSLFQCLLGVDASKVRVRGRGKGRVEVRRGRRGRKRSCGCGSRHATGVPLCTPCTALPARAAEPGQPGFIWDGPLLPPARPRRSGGGTRRRRRLRIGCGSE